MPSIDDQLRTRMREAAPQPAGADDLVEHLGARKRRRAGVRRAGTVGLVVVVLAGTTGAFVALGRAFRTAAHPGHHPDAVAAASGSGTRIPDLRRHVDAHHGRRCPRERVRVHEGDRRLSEARRGPSVRWRRSGRERHGRRDRTRAHGLLLTRRVRGVRGSGCERRRHVGGRRSPRGSRWIRGLAVRGDHVPGGDRADQRGRSARHRERPDRDIAVRVGRRGRTRRARTMRLARRTARRSRCSRSTTFRRMPSSVRPSFGSTGPSRRSSTRPKNAWRSATPPRPGTRCATDPSTDPPRTSRSAADSNTMDIGIGEPLCDVSTVVADFTGDGRDDTALVGMEGRNGRCTDAAEGTEIVAMDTTGDGLRRWRVLRERRVPDVQGVRGRRSGRGWHRPNSSSCIRTRPHPCTRSSTPRAIHTGGDQPRSHHDRVRRAADGTPRGTGHHLHGGRRRGVQLRDRMRGLPRQPDRGPVAEPASR